MWVVSNQRKMEQSQHGLLEELLMLPGRENGAKFSVSDDHQSFPSEYWSYDQTFNNTLDLMFNPQAESEATFAPCPSNEIQSYFNGNYTPMDMDNNTYHAPPFQVQDGELGLDLNALCYNNDNSSSKDNVYNFEERYYSCSSFKNEKKQLVSVELPVFSIGSSEDRRRIRSTVKKVEGQPAKNLMAERRRRKRLNDRLSMLRSVVPKISKMDRTSILGDTVDYMKELLEKIHKLKGRDTEANSLENLKELNKTSELAAAKNPSRFDVRRMEKSTGIDISCPAKPGMLLSMVNTIESLGLDIQQCVISCFEDFSLQASCVEAEEHQASVSNEDLKYALYRNAGHCGRRL